eukprot:4908350-Prymnesium_polylepis.1
MVVRSNIFKVRRSGYVAPGERSARAGLWGLPGGLAGLGLSEGVTGTVMQALKHPLGLSCQRTTPRNTRVHRGLSGYARGREVGPLALCG